MNLKSLYASVMAVIALALLSILAVEPALAQTTYPGQYLEANCAYGTATTSVAFTSATPTVGTWATPPWSGTNVAGSGSGVGTSAWACPFVITANAPTGLSTNTQYWAVPISVSAGTFYVATSAANALAGTYAATTGASTTATTFAYSLLTTATAANVGVVSLPAGDWDCSSSVYYLPATSTSVTNLQQGLSGTSATIGALGSYSDLETAANVMTAVNNPVQLTPLYRQAVAAGTSLFVVADATFTVSTLNATSDLRCRKSIVQG